MYYGSFAALAEREDWDRAAWEAELRETLSHELTHHMESRGGLHGLDDQDAAELDAWRQEFRDDPSMVSHSEHSTDFIEHNLR